MTVGFVLAMVAGSNGAHAMDDETRLGLGAELIAIAHGDFDCSGTEGQASLYRDKEGTLIVELALQAAKDKLSDPFSAGSGATIAFDKADDKGCQALLLTDDLGETYAVGGLENEDVLIRAQETAGDTVPDAHVVFRAPQSGPDLGIFDFGLDFELCDWDRLCWNEGCANACAAWGVIASYPCDPDGDGEYDWCNVYGCTHWKQHCVVPGW